MFRKVTPWRENAGGRIRERPAQFRRATRLVQQFCLGDRSALAAIVQIWEHRLLTIAYRVVGNVHDAEEVRQIVLLKLAQSLPKLDDPARFAGWLRRCAVNQAITWLRRRNSETQRRETSDDARADARRRRPHRRWPPNDRNGCNRGSAGSTQTRGHALLRFDQGLTIRQIAGVLEKPPLTVHSRIAKALGKLREQLGADHEEGIAL